MIDFSTIGAGGPPDPARDPFSAYRYLDARRQNLVLSARQRPLLRIWDHNHAYIGTINNETSVECEELMADTGSANVVVRKNGWLSDFILYDRRAEQDLHLTIDPMPTNRSWRTRWGGKVTMVQAKRDSRGLHTVELEAVSNREHLKHILAACNPVFPPEVQLPKMYVSLMNCRTNLTVALFINLARQFFPLLSIPDNIFNPGAWLGVNFANLDPLNWPIQPQFINPLFDQSRIEAFASRWTDMHSASEPLLEDSGCHWRAYTFLHGEDTESPHPELAKLGELSPGIFGDLLGDIEEVTNDLFMPRRNAIILACEDRSGVTGLTGTVIDGAINMIAATADNLLTEVLIPEYDENGDGQTDPLIRKWFAAAPAEPTIVFRDEKYSGIIESRKSVHGTTAKTVVTGGRSPTWLNNAIRFGIQYGLSQLSAIIYYYAAAAGTISYQQPATPGLEALYNDELSDVFFAYMRFSDPRRVLRAGDYAYLETFEPGNGAAYTISGVMGLRSGHFRTRPYQTYAATARNASPYIYGVDFHLGDRVGFEMANVIYTDQVTGVRFSWSKDEPVDWQMLIGSDENEVDPVSKALRAVAGIWNMFGMWTGSAEIF